MKNYLSIICLATALFAGGCTKDRSTTDPCENLLSEKGPDRVILKFVDKTTGASLIGTAGLNKESIIITDLATGLTYNYWAIVQHKLIGDSNVALELAFFPGAAGKPSYKIALGNKAEAVLDFTVASHASESPCRPTYYSVSDFQVLGKEFSYIENEGRVYKNMLIVKI